MEFKKAVKRRGYSLGLSFLGLWAGRATGSMVACLSAPVRRHQQGGCRRVAVNQTLGERSI